MPDESVHSLETGSDKIDLSDLAGRVRASISQNGASAETTNLLRQYVASYLQESIIYDVRQSNHAEILAEIQEEVGINWSDPTFSPIIQTQIEDTASGRQCASSDVTQSYVERAADPIEMFSGQFVYETTDMMIRGAGIDFVFQRVYKNQSVYFGPLGCNWDHNFNIHIRQIRADLICSTGALRDDFFRRHPRFGQAGFNYWVPPDGVHSLIEESGNSFLCRSPAGLRRIFEQDPVDPLFHRVSKIEDRFGNYLLLKYDGPRIKFIEINHPARRATFGYDKIDRIESVRDHMGREWVYRYDDFGDLVCARSPTSDRHPEGSSTFYEYSSSGYSAPLQHNLVSITDAKGQRFLENEYGTNAQSMNFNRVVRQRQGEGDYLFDYERVVENFEFDYAENERPAIQVNQVMRNGQSVHSVFNKFGNLLLKEQYIQKGGRFLLAQSRYRYNKDGSITSEVTPECCLTQYYYGRDDYLRRYGVVDAEVASDGNLTASLRAAFGNLLSVVRRSKRLDFAQSNPATGIWGNIFPNVLAPNGSEDIITKFTYEPDFQQTLTVSDARYTLSADPQHPETPKYAAHLTRYAYSTGRTRVLRRVTYPNTTFPSVLPDGRTGVVNANEQYVRYDTRGRPRLVKDPAGNITENRYFRGGIKNPKVGYLEATVRDISSLRLSSVFDVNDVGVTTMVTNPRRFRTTMKVNASDQVEARISDGPGFHIDYFYDENGLLERQERDNIDEDGQPSPDGKEVKEYQYDASGNVTREEVGGTDRAGRLRTSYRYTAWGGRSSMVLPLRNRLRYHYNERCLLIATTRGSGSLIASTSRTSYDADGRKTEHIDERGYRTRFVYDTFGRVVSEINASGSVQQYEHDKIGNAVVSRFFERRPDGTYQLLKRSEFEYDQRGSMMRQIDALFNGPIATNDIAMAPDMEFKEALRIGEVDIVKTEFFYDENKRLFRKVNDKRQEIVWQFDGVNRTIREQDHLGNYVISSYDENSNVTRTDRHELVASTSGGILREDVFSNLSDYDFLDRRTCSTDGLGNKFVFRYDSRNNLTVSTDPLGNVTRSMYDVYNRKWSVIAELTASGLGGGLPEGKIATKYCYDSNGNLIRIVDGNGNSIIYHHDELNRLSQTVYADGSATSIKYDASDNVVVHTNCNGLRIVYQIDPLGRRERLDIDQTSLNSKFPYPAGCETFESYRYDGLGRAVSRVNDFSAITSKVDSLGRVYQESIDILIPQLGGPGTLTVGRKFDSLSNRTDLIYPNGRSVHFDYDELNRVEAISNTAFGNGYPGSTNFAAKYDIAKYSFRGLRLDNAHFGNRTSTDIAYDAAGRAINIRHAAQEISFLEIQQLSDGAGNRRFLTINPTVPLLLNSEAYKFDSMYRLCRSSQRPMLRFDPIQFEPPAAALPAGSLNGQGAINNVIGPLPRDPLVDTLIYDAAGNRLREQQFGQGATVYTPDELNRYTQVAGLQMVYDLECNLTDDGDILYAFNYRNQLTEAFRKATGQTLVRLYYDSIGRLVGSYETGEVTFIVHDGMNAIEEYDAKGLISQYVHEAGIDRPCQIAANSNEHWYHRDFLSSTRQLSDAVGQTTSVCYEYEPFGQLIRGPAIYNPYLFCGKRLHRSVNLYDSKSRHYSPRLGRFIQRDPKGAVDGPNLFAYVGNNPVSLIDALGTQKQSLPSDSSSPEFLRARETFRNNPFSIEGLKALVSGLEWALENPARGSDGHILSNDERKSAFVHVQFGFGEKSSRWLSGAEDLDLSALRSEWKQNALAGALIFLPQLLQGRRWFSEVASGSLAFRNWNADHRAAVSTYNMVMNAALESEKPGLQKGIELMAWENWRLTDILFKREGLSGKGLDAFFVGAGENLGRKAFLEAKGNSLALSWLKSTSEAVGMDVRQGSWTYIELQLEAHAAGGQHAELATALAHELRLQMLGLTPKKIRSFASTSSGFLYELDFLEGASFSVDKDARRLVSSPLQRAAQGSSP